MLTLESTIIRNFLHRDAFARVATTLLKKEYFQTGSAERVIFETLQDYFAKYNSLPTPEALGINLSSRTDLSDGQFKASTEFLQQIATPQDVPDDLQWIKDKTETFCQDNALRLGIMQSLEIIQDKGGKGLSKGAIPQILQDALSVTFDTRVGHDYFDDAEEYFDNYQQSVKRIPFDIKHMNLITQGGWKPKTLNIYMASSGAGKSLVMCHSAASDLQMGFNVLYITAELSEDMVRERIDSNLLNIDMGLVKKMSKPEYMRRIQEIRSKTTGRLKVQEYGPATASAATVRHLLNELKTKKNFIPDIIYIDYLNIFLPFSLGKNDNTYTAVKRVAEEFRALAKEFNLPVVSATQTNRAGYGVSPEMENVSDSLGLVMTADMLIAIRQDDDHEQRGVYEYKQLKSRYGDKGKYTRFLVGVDKNKMRLFTVDDTDEQMRAPTTTPALIVDNTAPIADNFRGFT